MDRLKLLLETTKQIDENLFSMAHFHKGCGSLEEGIYLLKTCGTSGCIIGWASCHPKFIGLRTRLDNHWYKSNTFDNRAITESLADYFNISIDDSKKLFFDMDQTKEQAIRRIQKLIKKD